MGTATAENLLTSRGTDTTTETGQLHTSQLFRLIRDKPLPVFGQSLKKLRAFLNKPNSSINKIVEILRSDPGFSCQLFAKANAMLTNHKYDIASTLDHAILVLGIPQVIAIGNTLPVVSEIANPRTKQRVYQCYNQAYHAGVQARELLYDSGKTISDSAFFYAQLRELYIVSLWIHASKEMETLLNNSNSDELYSPSGLFHETGSRIAKHLFLPDTVWQSFSSDANPSRLIQSINFACRIARLSETGWYTKRLEETVIQAADQLGLNEAVLFQNIHKNAVIAARECRLYPIRHAANRLIEVVDNQAPKNRLQAITEKRDNTNGERVNKTSPGINSKPDKKTAKSGFEYQLETLRSMGKSKRPPQEILSYSFQILGQLFTQNPVAFLLLDKSKSSLRSRFISGFMDKSLFIPLQRTHIFGLLMQKQQSVHISAINRKKYVNVLPPNLPVNITERDFIAMSLFIQKKPVGLFYVEGANEKSITTIQYQQFVTVCQATGAALDEVKRHAKKETTQPL